MLPVTTTQGKAYQHRFIQTNGIYLHVVLAGPEDGPPILLLHGFPEFWYGWRHQIPYLAQQGFRVIVPDQRGYNLSQKPRGKGAYHIDTLTQDIVGLINSLGYERVFLVGHDWGAAVAWWVATHAPQYLHKLVILNVPYPTIMGAAAQQFNWQQLLRSWYIFFFFLPYLPEKLILASSRNPQNNLLRLSGHPTTFTDQDLEIYRQAWCRPRALTSMINWYRHTFSHIATMSSMPAPGSIIVPTLMLWGKQDAALGSELAPPSIELCQDGQLIFFPEASHWLQHDEIEAVNHHLARFCR